MAELAGPSLRALVSATGESAHLAVRDGIRAVFLNRELAPAILRVDTAVGAAEPLHCTAVGKALLLGLSEAELVALYPTGALERYTGQTIVSLEELLGELARSRARGYTYDEEELHPGVHCLAGPVVDRQGRVVAAIGISGPATRITRERLGSLASAVQEQAVALSAQLGFVEAPMAAS